MRKVLTLDVQTRCRPTLAGQTASSARRAPSARAVRRWTWTRQSAWMVRGAFIYVYTHIWRAYAPHRQLTRGWLCVPVIAAISMTLCEIATAAHQAAPLECRPYTTHGGKDASAKVQGECVGCVALRYRGAVANDVHVVVSLPQRPLPERAVLGELLRLPARNPCVLVRSHLAGQGVYTHLVLF